jgi:DNA-binding MarR family transcriptional regulator
VTRDVAPRWLDDTEQRAWRGLVAFVTVGIPRIERTFRAHGLVHLEYGILAVLSEHQGGLRLRTLAEVLGVSPSRLTHRMSKLVERGLVEQQPSPEDGRGSVASITADGHDLLRAIAPTHVEDVRRAVFDHLDAESVDGLSRAMTSIASGLGVGLADAVGRAPAPEDGTTRRQAG